MNVSVKVMLSYDYNHFEVCLSEEELDIKGANELRKTAQRLADEAVRQYIVAKKKATSRDNEKSYLACLEHEVKTIRAFYTEDQRTPEQKAKIKEFEDFKFNENNNYDYEDDKEIPF